MLKFNGKDKVNCVKVEVANSNLRVKIVSIVNEDSSEKGMFLTYFLKMTIYIWIRQTDRISLI